MDEGWKLAGVLVFRFLHIGWLFGRAVLMCQRPEDGSFGAVLDVELVEDSADMSLRGVVAYEKGMRYLFVASPLGHEGEDNALAFGQAAERA